VFFIFYFFMTGVVCCTVHDSSVWVPSRDMRKSPPIPRGARNKAMDALTRPRAGGRTLSRLRILHDPRYRKPARRSGLSLSARRTSSVSRERQRVWEDPPAGPLANRRRPRAIAWHPRAARTAEFSARCWLSTAHQACGPSGWQHAFIIIFFLSFFWGVLKGVLGVLGTAARSVIVLRK
jgi:hypothetical protein